MPNEARTILIRNERDVILARRTVSAAMDGLRASPLQKTRLVTAASELARNTLIHGGGGRMELSMVRSAAGTGVVLVFSDEGQGIADVEAALRDGFTTGSGLGLGLGGAKRLVDEFGIHSEVGGGTRVRVAGWVTGR